MRRLGFCLGHDLKSAEIVVEEITDKGGKAIACGGDVGSLQEIKQAIKQTIDAFGRIDILINNAGISGGGKKMLDISYEECNRRIFIDLTSAFMFSKEVIPFMLKQCCGKIVHR